MDVYESYLLLCNINESDAGIHDIDFTPETICTEDTAYQEYVNQDYHLTQSDQFMSTSDSLSDCCSPYNWCLELAASAVATTPTAPAQDNKRKDPLTKAVLPPCRICGDAASGFHYGVNSCEACKGFYRRALRRNRPYRCRGGRGNCNIKGCNPRKICGYCRYKCCLSLGMSPEAIKPGRYTHTKRTQDTLEVLQMKRDARHCTITAEEVDRIVDRLVQFDHFVLTNTSVPAEVLEQKSKQVLEDQRLKRETFGIDSSVLPEDLYYDIYHKTGMDVDNRKYLMDFFATCVEKHVPGYIKFTKGIPGFTSLSTKDQIKLLKHSREEFWLIGSHRGFDTDRRTFVAPNGTAWTWSDYAHRMGEEFANYEFDMAERLKSLDLTREETVVLKTLCLMASDRCVLDQPDKVEEVQLTLMHCYRTLLRRHHKNHYHRKLAQSVGCLVSLRDMMKLSQNSSYRRALFLEVLENHPMLKELVTF